MVDATEASESEFMNVDLIRNMPNPILVVITAGNYEVGEFGRKLVLNIEINNKNKKWTVNKSSASNMIKSFGSGTDGWVGKKAALTIIKVNGKDSIVAIPIV